MNVPIGERIQLQNNLEAAGIKLLYAFLWQEWVVTNASITTDPEFNEQGAALIGPVNDLANQLSNFPVYDVGLAVRKIVHS